jgi:hypothetical protein
VDTKNDDGKGGGWINEDGRGGGGWREEKRMGRRRMTKEDEGRGGGKGIKRGRWIREEKDGEGRRLSIIEFIGEGGGKKRIMKERGI